MGSFDDFQNEPLQDMVAVGAVRAHSVRLWLRSSLAGPIRIGWWREGEKEPSGETVVIVPKDNEQDNTHSFQVPASAENASLIPLQRYRFRAVHLQDNHLVGEGRFETAPEESEATPAKFSIALFSCHQPFDKHGGVDSKAEQMLRASLRCLEEHNTKFVLAMGDQMYSDFPPALSLFDPDYFARVAPSGRKELLSCSSSEVRRLYQRRYRHFWNLPGWRALHSAYPCYPVIDDHDIIDNWGSDPAHQRPEWQAVGEGARQAYFDYQGSRVLDADPAFPLSFHYSFSYGHTSVFVMDLRSERTAGEGGRLYSDEQETALRDFLDAHSHQKLVFLVLSVPIVHLPRFLARIVARLPPSGEDFSDRWSSGAHLRDRDRFLRIIHAHQRRLPSQRLVLLSGDIHIGCVHRIQWGREGPVLYQMISSPITHDNGFLVPWASKLIIRTNRQIATRDGSLRAAVRFLPRTGRQSKNPYGGVNLGLIEVQTPEPQSEPKIRFLLFGHQGEEPICVYRSPEI